MKILVKIKSTNQVFNRVNAFGGEKNGKVQVRLKSLDHPEKGWFDWPKDDTEKIKKSENPEYFL